MLQRRSFLSGLLAAPLIVRPGILMPVKPILSSGSFTFAEYSALFQLPSPIFGEIVHIFNKSNEILRVINTEYQLPAGESAVFFYKNAVWKRIL